MLLSIRGRAVPFLGLLSQLAVLVSGQTTNTTSIFNLPLGQNLANYTFALNIPSNSSDVYFHLSGPTDYSWVAVGTGTEMKGSLMFLLYSSASGKDVTLSPRLCSGEKEPVYSSSIAVDLLDGTGISDNRMTVNARCSNCSYWGTGELDLQSTSQPWIFGLGPHGGTDALLRSDSKTVSIERHSEYGRFTMDMVHATGGSGGLPTSFRSAAGSALVGDITSDSNWPSIIHALCLCGGFILLMPSGVIFLRVSPRSVRWHWVNQTLAVGVTAIGLFLGIYLSTMFTKSESFSSLHQILGILLVIAVLAQWGLGFWHHRVFKRMQAPTKFGLIHRYLGRIILVLAVVNGGIGLTWSYASISVVIGYSIAVLAVGVGYIAVFSGTRLNSRKRHNTLIQRAH